VSAALALVLDERVAAKGNRALGGDRVTAREPGHEQCKRGNDADRKRADQQADATWGQSISFAEQRPA
jgi:hypothetical protein